MNALSCRACMRGAVVALALAWCVAASAQPKTSAPRTQYDGATPHIDAVIHDPQVARHIAAWGLSGDDVRAQVAALSLADRARLALLLQRRWRAGHADAQAALQARYLVTFSLLRQSTSLAGSISGGAARR